jgi:23S rRNA-/tRNA-specific pseudouridylate synthase
MPMRRPFLSSHFRNSRARIQQLIRGGFVRVGGATSRPNRPVWNEIKYRTATRKIETGETIPLTIHAERRLIVINKATGMTVHPGGVNTNTRPSQRVATPLLRLVGHRRKGMAGIVTVWIKKQRLPVAAKRRGASRIIKTVLGAPVERIYLAWCRKIRKQTGVIENKIDDIRIGKE